MNPPRFIAGIRDYPALPAAAARAAQVAQRMAQ
mgnify:CR=1 FL=1